MIPISRDPKRFVAALNKFRTFVPLTANVCVNSRSNNLSIVNPVSQFSTATIPPAGPPIDFLVTNIRKESDVFSAVFQNEKPKETELLPLALYGPRESAWYTGKPPLPGLCPGVTKEGKIHSLPLVTANKEGKWTKKALQDYFDNTWTMTEVLLGSLQGEEAFMRPPYHELRHPMIFYYGHPAALYVNKFRVAGLIKDPINPYYESIFETGVDEMSWDDLSKNKMPWPSVAEVHAYRTKVYKTVSSVIQSLTEDQLAKVGQGSPVWAILLGFEHERIHLETSSVLINELPLKYVRFPEGMPPYHQASIPKETILNPIPGKDYPVNEMLNVPKQTVTIGKPKDFPTFGWDNEYGYREYEIQEVKVSKFKISNGEYLEFVKEGGYAKNEYWSEAGWKWKSFRNVKWPTFWMRKGPQGHHEYDLRLIFDSVPMPWSWPVSVCYHEAVAFANWKAAKTGKKYRILTELEHRAIRNSVKDGKSASVEEDHAIVYGGVEHQKAGYNINMAFSSMTPVDAYAPNEKGFHDVFGNAWEWMEDYFAPLPGFEIHPYYEDFSTPCFDGLHNVIQGGSFISTGDEASVHSRFHFRPHFYQHSSFRLVEQLTDKLITSDTDAPGPYVGNYPFRRSQEKLLANLQNYENQQNNLVKNSLNQMISKHFGQNIFVQGKSSTPLQPLKAIITDFVKNSSSSSTGKKAIEVGCGVGGITFDLLRDFSTVIGIDHQQEYVSFARQLLKGESLQYSLAGEGDHVETIPVTAPVTLADLKNKKIEFRCADPMCLPAELNNFEFVFINDVLDKVSSPNSVLGRLGGVRGLVKPDGLLLIASSFQWNEEKTPRSLWLNDSSSSSEEELTRRLAADGFELKMAKKVPIVWLDSKVNIQGKLLTVIGFQRKI